MFEATWEEAESIDARSPDFHLEDKVKVWGAGNVMNKTGQHSLIKYTRRKGKGRKVNAGAEDKEVNSQ